MKLLVDADYVVYKCCAGAETEVDWGDDVILVTSKFSDAYACVERELKNPTRLQRTSTTQETLWLQACDK